MKKYPPFGNTLRLPVRFRLFSNNDGSRQRNHVMTTNSTHQMIEYCAKENYGQVTDVIKCKPCPPGSIPFARGSYCISQEAANNTANMNVDDDLDM